MPGATEPLSVRAAVSYYLERIKLLSDVQPENDPWETICRDTKLTVLRPLLEKIFSVPATSAPVECVFSHIGLIMRPHRARMSDRMLSDLVMLKCNKHI